MTEDPRGRGYPSLAPPATRAMQAWNRMWERHIGVGPAKLIRAQKVLNRARVLQAKPKGRR